VCDGALFNLNKDKDPYICGNIEDRISEMKKMQKEKYCMISFISGI
jgi:hypothetical protein